ncbi:FadR/GntR family transcriptional regulator [Shumkonia mesophila]|uniref:FadR/GntR family transcriptional regulator n=1 Tax=Shumkonia mesophila TaxID=2838854 RepID=UPI0029345D56|nr:FCD domain-containing protein [Shumkonia mesophila]
MFDKISPIHRSQIVAEQIVSKIQLAKMQIGDKLASEREIAKSMDVSRNTLREAIAMLQVAGILEVRRSSGIFIAALPDQDVVKRRLIDGVFATFTDSETAIDARIAMEPGVAILASKTATDEEWKSIDRHLDAMREAVDKKDIEEYRKNDNDMHKLFATATHNEVIISTILPIIDTARQPLWSAIKKDIYNSSVLHESYDEHRLIVEAMRTTDEYYIFRAVRRHLEKSKARLGIDIDG